MQACSAVWASCASERTNPSETISPHPLHFWRGIGGIDGDDPATGPCCLVRQDDEERAPPRVTDALCQMVILHHVGGLQVFVIDRVVAAERAPAPSCGESPAAGAAPSDAPSPAASPPCAGGGCPSFGGRPALGGFQRPLGLAIPAGMEDARAVGERGERFNAEVYAGLLSSRREAAALAPRHRRSRHTSRRPLG